MEQEELATLEAAFVDGFRAAADKQGFLRLAGIPLELARGDGPGLKLMQVAIEEAFEVGRASPGFASRELVYHPLPGRLVTTRARLSFRYVSSKELCEISLADVLARSPARPRHEHVHSHHDGAAHGHGHRHPHHHHHGD